MHNLHGRVALGVASQGSHRSVRAQLRHTAPQVTGSLRDGTPSGPPRAGGSGYRSSNRSKRCPRTADPAVDAGPATSARRRSPRAGSAANADQLPGDPVVREVTAQLLTQCAGAAPPAAGAGCADTTRRSS